MHGAGIRISGCGGRVWDFGCYGAPDVKIIILITWFGVWELRLGGTSFFELLIRPILMCRWRKTSRPGDLTPQDGH